MYASNENLTPNHDLAKFITASLRQDHLELPDLERLQAHSEVVESIYWAHRQGGPAAVEQTLAVVSEQRSDLASIVAMCLQSARKWRIYSPDEVMQFEPPQFLVPGAIAKGELSVLYGASGHGKSHVSLYLATQVAQDNSVLYLAGEGKSGLPYRLQGLQHFHPHLTRLPKFIIDPVQLVNRTELDQFMSMVMPYKPALLVFDTLATCNYGVNENDTAMMTLLVNNCSVVQREMGCAILLVHHTAKNGPLERGNGALRCGAFSMIQVVRTETYVDVASDKLKDGTPFDPYGMEIKAVGHKVAVVHQTIRPGGQPQPRRSKAELRILQIVAEGGENGMTRSEITSKAGLPDTTVGNYLNALQRDQLVFQEQRRKPYAVTSKGYDLVAELHEPRAA